MIINYIHWNPNPEIINIFGISVRYYGLLFVSGLILVQTFSDGFLKERIFHTIAGIGFTIYGLWKTNKMPAQKTSNVLRENG